MMNVIAKMLSECETSGAAPLYYEDNNGIVNIHTRAQNIIVISDIHIGAGLGPDATYSGTENFYADRALKRFLESYIVHEPGEKSVLIINGDFIDFLRITTIPKLQHEFQAWHRVLEDIGAESPATVSALMVSIATEKKEKYGLKTNDYKSVWKLMVASFGHTVAFDALADWVGNGNQIIIIKGNHDLEWYWLAVRNYFRYILGEKLSLKRKLTPEEVLKRFVLPNIIFVDNAVVLNRELYIEHGHRYDNFTKVCPENNPKFKDKELNLPFGSFFNRYLLNKIELRYPFLENVRPRISLLPMLIKEDFPLALRVFFRYLPFLAKTIGKKRYWPMIMQTFSLLFSVSVPAIIIFIALYFQFKDDIIPAILRLFAGRPPKNGVWGFIEDKGIIILKDTAMFIGAYFLSRLISMLQLVEPSSLKGFAENKFSELQSSYPGLRIITLGHTHDPEQKIFSKDRWYYNTGTWVPVIEVSSASIRQDKTYTFLRFRNTEGNIQPSPLLRWNDEACREEDLVLVRSGDTIPDSTIRKKLKHFNESARWMFMKR